METAILTGLHKKAAANSTLADGLAEYSGEWTTTEVAHLLKRTLFGVKSVDLNYFQSLSMTQAVDEILTPAPALSSVPLNSYSSNGYTDPTGVASWDTWINTGIDYLDTEL